MSESSNFVYSGLSELEETERNLIGFNTFIVKTFLQHSNYSKNVLDFGAGIGTLSSIWRKFNQDSMVTCLELDKKQLQILRDRKFKTLTSLNSSNSFEYIFTSNVLEHIENDGEALNQIYRSLINNGRLGIFVPANQILYSNMDKKLEHFRRYSKSDLKDKVRSAGFEIDYISYVDFLGFFALGFAKIFKLNFDSQNSSRLKFYDKVIWPTSRFLDVLGARYLFGKNLLLLARKP
jgi:SAM-dependent methyltransferase